MTLLAENDRYQLFKTNRYASCNYIVYMKLPEFKQEVARSMMLTKRIVKYFTSDQIAKARKILHTNVIAGLC